MTRNRPLRAALPALCAAGFLAACNGDEAKSGGGWRVADDGVYVETRDGEFDVVRLQVIDDRAMRVTASPDGDVDTAPDTMWSSPAHGPTAMQSRNATAHWSSGPAQ